MVWCWTCNGLGVVECLCGGDFCVCMDFGEAPCPGCGGDVDGREDPELDDNGEPVVD